MRRLAAMVAFMFLVLSAGGALAQEKPPGPGGGEAPPSTGGTDETKPPPDDTKPPPARDPGKDEFSKPTEPPKAKAKVIYGLGASVQFNMVPGFFLDAFTLAHKNKSYGLYQPAFGIHFLRRKKLMDMTVRVMFGFYHLKDGNWLGRGHGWDEVDYTEFHNMNFLWADVTWTWHTRLAKGLYLAYGAGIGIGWVTGKVYTTPSLGCSESNYSNTNDCKPDLAICDGTSCTRSSLKLNPDREQEKSVPPILPAVNALIGLRYDFFRHLTAKLEFGIFLPGLFYLQFSLTGLF